MPSAAPAKPRRRDATAKAASARQRARNHAMVATEPESTGSQRPPASPGRATASHNSGVPPMRKAPKERRRARTRGCRAGASQSANASWGRAHPRRRALDSASNGAMAKAAAGSALQSGPARRSRSSTAPKGPPRHTARPAQVRRARRRRPGRGPTAAPKTPAWTPDPATDSVRDLWGIGRPARRSNWPRVESARAESTAAEATPTCCWIPRSLKVRSRGGPGQRRRRRRRAGAVLAKTPDLTALSCS